MGLRLLWLLARFYSSGVRSFGGGVPVSANCSIAILYLIGGHWVYPFLARREMSMPYIGRALHSGKDNGARVLLFSFGVAHMVMSLFAAS